MKKESPYKMNLKKWIKRIEENCEWVFFLCIVIFLIIISSWGNLNNKVNTEYETMIKKESLLNHIVDSTINQLSDIQTELKEIDKKLLEIENNDTDSILIEIQNKIDKSYKKSSSIKITQKKDTLLIQKKKLK